MVGYKSLDKVYQAFENLNFLCIMLALISLLSIFLKSRLNISINNEEF